MRRTYKSKKETGGALDPRDVLLTMDSKSSLFDAFYINNIKQTKRELSVVPSVQFAASNRVRKRKYVKRLKEQEPVVRESSSTSAFLTPDKSFRVNKAPDPFDQLLNSSNRSLIETKKFNSSKKQKSKTYCQIKSIRKKKINYSSGDSTDSDKENSNSSIENSTTQNNSDVLSHKLLIERDNEKSPKQDESIADIVKNLSLFKESKDKVSTSPRGVKNKITHLSEISNSPLCSTPFFDKYRGKSIYKFSPIPINGNDSPSSLILAEGNNDVESCMIEVKEKKYDSYNENKHETINDVNVVSCEVQSPILPHKTSNETPKTKTVTSDPLPEVTLQTSEVQPFLGFTNIEVSKTDDLDTIADKWNKLEKDDSIINVSVEVVNECVSNTNENSIETIEVIEKETQSNSSVHGSHTNSSLESDDNESFYGTCNSEDFEDDNQPIVVIERLNDSVFQKYYDKMADYSNVSNNTHSDDVFSDEYASVDDRSSINDSSEHDNISSESIKGDEVCGENTSQVSIDDHLQNHSLDSSSNSDVNKTEEHDNISSESIIGDEVCGENTSQVSIDDHLQNHSLDSGSNSDINKTEEHDNISSESIIGDEVCGENTSQVSIDDHLQNHSLDSSSNSDVNKTEEHDNISRESIISDEICEENTSQITKDDNLQNHSLDSDCNSDGYESEDEVYISFVTTRRRNDIINDSLILGLDNSITSGSSAEVDKTVLKRDSLIEDLEGNGDKTLIKDKSGDSNTDAKNNSNNNIVQEGHNIETVSKSSPNDFNKSISKEKSINRTSFKLRKGSKSPNAINISTNIKIDSNLANKVMTRKSVRLLKESIGLRSSLKPETSASSLHPSAHGSNIACDLKQGIVLQPGKRWERSLSIYRRMTTMSDHFDSSILDDEPLNKKGRKYRQSVISTMEMQDFKGSLYNDSINSRRSTFVSKPSRSTIRIVRDLDTSRSSLCSTSVLEESQGFLTEDCDDTIVELSKLSIADSEHEVTVLEKFHDTSSRFPTARDYVLRRCNQTDIVLFDECYPDTVLKNCRKIGEGVYGEVFLWRAGDGKARVLKIIPIAGNIKVNGENQKDYNEIISEIVIAMELSALRTPIDEIEKHFNEGKSVETLDLHSVENATDVFNEVLAVRCVYGTYPSRLLDLWDLYDECKGSENDNPAILPIDQQYIVLELANAGQDLESYQFNNAEQAYALFKQVAFGLAVAEEAYQFEHRDLHWGNVLISPTDQKHATFVIRGRVYRVARRGVAASLIDYSLSRASLRLPSGTAELYNDLSTDDSLFDAVGDYQFEVYRLMRDKLGNDWKNFEPYTNILWLHYTVDKMITSLRYSRTNTKIHKHYIAKLKEIKNRVLDYGSAVQYVLTDNDL